MPEQSLRSFRIVCEKKFIPLVEALLTEQGYGFEPEPFSPFCRRLVREPRPLGGSLAAFFGYVYIQDRSSMLPPAALAPKEGEAVLDMCASPGSKTSFLAQLSGPEGFVLGNEPTPSRLATLRGNLHRLNLLNAATCSYPGESLPLAPGSWPAIQLDPPCSGWGTAEKNPRVMRLWRGDKLKRLIGLQRKLLARAAELLKPGGRVVYSTCTTNQAENEAQVAFAEQELGLKRVPLDPFEGFSWQELPGGEGTLRVDGERSRAQGFYLALLKKAGETSIAIPSPEAADVSDAHASKHSGGHAQRRDAVGRVLTAEALAGPCCDPDLLPAGKAALFGDEIHFLPAAARALLPDGFVWRGPLLGRPGGGRMTVDTRLRALLPRVPAEGTALVLDDVSDVSDLLAGRSRQTNLAGGEAALWWRDLPLGRLVLKQGRAIASFK